MIFLISVPLNQSYISDPKFNHYYKMEEDVPDRKKWEDMDIDILVKIFQTFDIFELTSGIARVCSTWRYAACDPLLWGTLDLSMLKSNFIKIPLEPYVYVDERSDKTLTRVLKISLNLSRGNISTLIFHFNLYVRDDQLTYIAERYRLKHYFLLFLSFTFSVLKIRYWYLVPNAHPYNIARY
ncbi:putative F-box domain, leucine-rich repeat domain superfamily, F-box-like domain superfamily [Helianthus debilis subsp. tardiflorus]